MVTDSDWFGDNTFFYTTIIFKYFPVENIEFGAIFQAYIDTD